jgi:two-component system, OmpR family, response regulator QseB
MKISLQTDAGSLRDASFGKAKGRRPWNFTMHILIIEDDIDLGPAILAALKQAGMTGVWVRRLGDAAAFVEEQPDCVLLDLGLPDGDGLAFLAGLRGRGIAVPVIVITARTALEDRLVGLDGGADDFLVKPVIMAELISRVGAVVRRSARQAGERWTFGELALEPRSFRAWLNGAALDLSPREFRLLVELARSPECVVSKSTLGQRMEPLGDPLDSATMEVHLSNLRRKIGAGRIRTVRGVGYQLVAGEGA